VIPGILAIYLIAHHLRYLISKAHLNHIEKLFSGKLFIKYLNKMDLTIVEMLLLVNMK